MKDIALIVNTVSHFSDVWPMFFGQNAKYLPPEMPKYLFTDDVPEGAHVPDDYKVLPYKIKDMYRSQFLTCIKEVAEPNCIYVSEDCVLYDQPQLETIEKISKSPALIDFQFVRFLKGDVNTTDKHILGTKLWELDSDKPFFYSNLPSLWHTESLMLVHKHGPEAHIGAQDLGQFEPQASAVAKQLGLRGAHWWDYEPKRGMHHYDSTLWPFICTAIVQRKWNVAEYARELYPLFEEYGVDPDIRGYYDPGVLRGTV